MHGFTFMLAVADPDLKLKGRGAVLIYLPCWLFSLLSFLLFFTKNKGGGGGSSPRSTTGLLMKRGLSPFETPLFNSLTSLDLMRIILIIPHLQII